MRFSHPWTPARSVILAALAAGCAVRGPLVPETGGSAEEPHAVGTAAGRVLVTWGAVHPDGRADILLSGDDFGPVRVNPVPRSAVAGRQVGPRAAVLLSGRVLVSWVDRASDPSGDILVAASDDGGRTFADPVRVNDDTGRAGQEYQDIGVLPDRTVVLAWLDERDAAPGNENQKQVYFASSADGGRTFARNFPLTSSPHGVCPCCRPRVAASPGGAVHVVFRDRAGEHLFLRVATRRPESDAFDPPITVSGGGWLYPACPVDGPAATAGPGEALRVAWMDGSRGRESLWQSTSPDGGRSFLPASLVEGRRRVEGRPVGQGPAAESLVPGRLPCCGGAAGSSGGGPDDGGRDNGIAGAISLDPGAIAGRPSLAWHPRLGVLAAWEDDGGRVWLRALDDPRASPMLVAGGDDATARSPQVAVAGDAVHVFWTESRWGVDAAEDGSVPRSRLAHAQWMVSGAALILVP